MKADIIWLRSTDSTNEEARRRLSDIDNLSVLSAYEQTAGRGQRGNRWSSAPGENLTFSIVLKFATPDMHNGRKDLLPEIKACAQFVLTQIASLSVIDFLLSYGIKGQIKWPNDIYVGPEKICGMLIENSIRGNHISSSIIGIGLNINQRNFEVTLTNPTSMVLACRKKVSTDDPANDLTDFDLKRCLEKLTDIFTRRIKDYFSAPAQSIREEYISHLWRLNETADLVDYTSLPSGHLEGPSNPVMNSGPSPGRQFTGIIRGVTPSGMLMVEDIEKGELKEFAFKEIGYILK